MLYTNDAIRKRKNKAISIKNKFNIIIYIILIPILIYNTILIAKAIINPYETPDFLGIKTYVIISGSMQPKLQIGDIVIVKNVEQRELEKGDIISFREGQNVVTHRIVDVLKNEDTIRYKTKGDNNNSEDEGLVEYTSIEGKVVKIIPKLGNVALILQGKITIIFIALVIYICLIRSGTLKRRRMFRRQKRMEYEKNKVEGNNEQDSSSILVKHLL